MKDISKLFETIMDFKGLSFLVTEQSLIKKWRPVFIFAMVSKYLLIETTIRFSEQSLDFYDFGSFGALFYPFRAP